MIMTSLITSEEIFSLKIKDTIQIMESLRVSAQK